MNRPLKTIRSAALRLLPLGSAMLLLCAACGQTDGETPAPETDPAAPPMVITDGSSAETIEEYYDRTAIISRNEWIQGSFLQTSQWATEYASLEYPGSECQVTFDSGYEVPSEMLPEGLTAGVTTWRADLRAPGGAEHSLLVQIFHFQKEGRQCFSGLLTGDARLTTRPAGYAYLALDTRFAADFRPLPEIEAPEGTLALDLGTADLAAGTVTSREVYPLSEEIAAVYCRREDGSGALGVLRLDSGEVLAREELEGSWEMDTLDGGLLVMRRYDGENQPVSRLECALTDSGAEIRRTAEAQDGFVLSTGVLRERNGSIYLEDTCLLRGSEDRDADALPLPEDPDPTDTLSYRVMGTLDGERFLYSCAGYEWLERTGVYDTAAGTENVLRSGGALPEWLLGWRENTGIGCVLDMDPADFARVDLTTGTAVPLTDIERRLGAEPVSRQACVNADCTRLAVLDETETELTLRVFDTGSQECLLEWEIPTGAGYGSGISLVGEHTAFFTIRRWSTDTGWVYRLNY